MKAADSESRVSDSGFSDKGFAGLQFRVWGSLVRAEIPKAKWICRAFLKYPTFTFFKFVILVNCVLPSALTVLGSGNPNPTSPPAGY